MKPLLAALAALALAGCAALEQPPAPVDPAPTPEPDTSTARPTVVYVPVPAPAPAPAPAPLTPELEEARSAAELLGFYQRVVQMNADEQRKEMNAVSAAFAKDRSNYNRLKLALLLAAPGAMQDDARALGLLEPVAGGPGPLKQLAGLVHGQLADRMRAQKRADQMREQLDQLRAVERSIIERGQQSQRDQPRKP